MPKTIVTHDGSFHSDEATAVFMLLNTEEYKDAEVVRTRDEKLIGEADIVVDVGAIYDFEKRRFDHHQMGFSEKHKDSDILLSSCGLVFRHFGNEVIENILKKEGKSQYLKYLQDIHKYMDNTFITEVDATDNGVTLSDSGTRYGCYTDFSSCVRYLNPTWDCDDDPNVQFKKAVELAGHYFKSIMLRYVSGTLSTIDLTDEAYKNRYKLDKSGKIINCDFPFAKNLERLEKANPSEPLILFNISKARNSWKVVALSADNSGHGRNFANRKDLPFAGLRNEELSKACGIPGGIFVHKNGFTSEFLTFESALAFAKLAVEYEPEK